MNDPNSAYSAPIPSRKMRFHQRRSAEERRGWVKRYERSGQTLKQFCEQHGLALSSFCLWKKRLAQNSEERTGRRGGPLVEVPLRTAVPIFGTDARSVAICLTDGLRIEIGAGSDIQWVAELVRAVRKLDVA